MSIKPIIETEEEFHTYTPADNGAGPLWCHGSTIIAGDEDQVYVAALETIPDQKPLNNCRWLLFRRTESGWQQVYHDTSGRTREPSPLVLLGNGTLVVSANPTLTAADAYSGPARPTVYAFGPSQTNAPAVEIPVWQGAPTFTEHSYRTVIADRETNEVLYMQNVGMDAAHMSLRRADGTWTGVGALTWPATDEYGESQPLRLCYPNVAMRQRAVHFLGVGDIVEPVAAWKDAKFAQSGRQWDYVFRRLFYACTPDIGQAPFSAWLELANLDDTAGQIRNGDIHVAADGTVHILWNATNVDLRLRDQFFPDQRAAYTLEYMTLQDGQIASHQTLARLYEGTAGPRPDLARFHSLPDGGLVVLASFTDKSTSPPTILYRLARLNGQALNWQDVPLQWPLPGVFLLNTQRAGSAPSHHIDLVGISPRTPSTLAYARIRLEQD